MTVAIEALPAPRKAHLLVAKQTAYKRITHAEKAAFWETANWALLDSDIAKLMKRSVSMVKYWRIALGKPDQPLREVGGTKRLDRVDTIKKLRAQGATLESIARRFGLSRQGVDQIVNPEKTYARVAARWNDRWADPIETCQICNKKEELSKHHADYAKPLSVIWLCKECHLVADARRRYTENFQKNNC